MGWPGSLKGFVRVEAQNSASQGLREQDPRIVLKVQSVARLYVGLSHHCWGKTYAPISSEAVSEVLVTVEVLI